MQENINLHVIDGNNAIIYPGPQGFSPISVQTYLSKYEVTVAEQRLPPKSSILLLWGLLESLFGFRFCQWMTLKYHNENVSL